MQREVNCMMGITMPRGDIRPVRFSIRSPDGGENNTVSDFDEIYFTVKQNFRMKTFLFQKRLTTNEIALQEDGSFKFTIQPQDTDNLMFGTYYFDIEVVKEEEIKQTFVGNLILTEEATYSENEG